MPIADRIKKLVEDSALEAPPDAPATPGAAPEGASDDAWARWAASQEKPADEPKPALSQKLAGPATAEPAQGKRVIDPALAEFLGQQTAKRAELAQAQGKADEARRWATMSNGFAKARDIVLQRPFDQEGMKGKLDEADRPVKNLLQQNEQDRQGLKDFGAQLDVNKNLTEQRTSAAMLDPNSDISKRAQLLAVAQGLIKPSEAANYSASMHADMLKGASIQEAMAHHAATEKELQRQHQEREASRKDDRDLNYARLDESARQHDLQFAAKTGKEKEIPPRQLERMSAIKDSLASLDELETLLGKNTTGPVMGRMASLNPWKGADPTRADALSKIMLESLPRAFKNGVPSVQDMKNAAAYVPNRTDTPEQIKAKIGVARQKVRHELELLKQTYGEGGLNTSRLTTGAETSAAPPAAPAKVQVISPEGMQGEIPADKLEAALARGFKRAG